LEDYLKMKKKNLNILFATVVAASYFTGCAAGNAGSTAGTETTSANAENTTSTENSTSTDATSTDASNEATTENTSEAAPGASDSEKIKVVTTIFPEYDWVKEVLGDNVGNAEITMLLDNGADLHSYQPTAEDVIKIASSDLFIYVGGESDGWVEDALSNSTNPDMQVINLLDVLGDSVKEEEIVEGMEHDHDHEHEHEEGEEHDHEHEEGEEHDHEHEEGEEHDHEHESDEHVWLSLKNTQVLVSAIADSLGVVDSANADTYQTNAAAYNEKLSALDAEYAAAVDAASVKTVLFGDRFPFRYMVDDYGLSYYAAFAGCSAETEASFETILFLAEKVNELDLSSVLTIESSDGKIADTIIQSTNDKDQQVLVLDSMQSTTSEDVAAGATYLSIMENNLEVLKEALK
jgi:zinc transport system substrate-binding protein